MNEISSRFESTILDQYTKVNQAPCYYMSIY